MRYIKNTLVVSFVLMLLWCSAQKGEAILFKPKYRPQSVYNVTLNYYSNNVTRFSGNPAVLRNLERRGVENPTIENVEEVTLATTTTGKRAADSSFSVNIALRKMKNPVTGKDLPPNTQVYGREFFDSLTVLDSLYAEGVADSLKERVLAAVRNTFTGLTTPPTYLKVGQSFSHDNAIELFLDDEPIKPVMTTTYKLTAIKNGLAYFNTTQQCNTPVDFKGSAGLLVARGKGKMVYDIENGFFKKFDFKIFMQANLELAGAKVSVTSKGNMSQVVQYASYANW